MTHRKNRPKDRFYVGRIDGTGRKFVFDTYKEAVAKIADIEKIDPEGVQRGDYYLDAPETFQRRQEA